MMRLLFCLFTVFVFGYLLLLGTSFERSSEKPAFLQVDEVAAHHDTQLEVFLHSPYRPNRSELAGLERDYGDLWAHLNHLYASNDIIAGKEYYTEDWFKQLASHYEGEVDPIVSRSDVQHKLHILNWSSDGLVCAAIDSSVVLKYTYPNQSVKTSTVDLAIVLLYQGDHWRVDGMKVISEFNLLNSQDRIHSDFPFFGKIPRSGKAAD